MNYKFIMDKIEERVTGKHKVLGWNVAIILHEAKEILSPKEFEQLQSLLFKLETVFLAYAVWGTNKEEAKKLCL